MTKITNFAKRKRHQQQVCTSKHHFIKKRLLIDGCKTIHFIRMKTHEKYMNRCVQLAQRGLGTTYPNPLVGSVIVFEDRIIGEGWHQKAGEAHAEVMAIQSVKNTELLSKATIYVSLEPCSHFGKTPPCADLIIAKNIPNIVIGTVDPFAKVSGNGIKKLVEAGRNVTVGVLEKACNTLNKRFFLFHKRHRPYIILKWAESRDGFLAPAHQKLGQPVWITNEMSRQWVHKWRTEEQSILVGTQTVLIDNPQLTARNWTGNQPIRIALDQKQRIPATSNIMDGAAPTIVITANDLDFSQSIAPQLAQFLYQKNIQSVIIEGGLQTLNTFIEANLWDEARIFKGTTIFGKGTKAPYLNTIHFEKQYILEDELLIGYNHDSNHF